MITHISKKLAQQIVDTLKDICGQNINFINEYGVIFASSDKKRIGAFHEIGLESADTGKTIEVQENDCSAGIQKGVNVPVFHNGEMIAVIGISGDPDGVRDYAHLAVRITKLLIREQELDDYNYALTEKKKYVIQSLIEGRDGNREYLWQCILDMKFSKEKEKRVVVVKTEVRSTVDNVSLLEQKIYQMFQNSSMLLYMYQYPNEYIGIIDSDIFEKISYIYKTFAEDNREVVRIGIGSSCMFNYLPQSYANARAALKSCNGRKENYALFEDLDIEIVLSCMDDFIKNNYVQKTIAKLSEEEIKLLKVYYEEDMSLSKTGERLFLHKNSLQYKLNKIQRICGYNPRRFRDAVALYMGIRME